MTTPIYPGTRIPFAGSVSVIDLAGRAGYNVALQPGGQPQQFSWEPAIDVGVGRKNLATDLDVQLMWVSAVRPTRNPPLVFIRLQYGHGETTFSLPTMGTAPQAPPAAGPQPVLPWMLPQRGLRLRLPARGFWMFLSTPAEQPPPPDPAPPAGAPCVLQVSAQPCDGVHPVNVPLTDAAFAQSLVIPPPYNLQQFPLGSTEFRLTDAFTGLPFAGAETVWFFDVTGAPTTVAPALTSLYGNWQPIPIWAAFWACDVNPTQASYR